MNWNDFYKSVKAGQFESVYFFAGPEELNKREALAALRRAILPEGLEQLNDVTLENCSAQDIIDSAETMPVMCEKRIVVVRDWPALTGGNARDAEKDTQRMKDWLQNMPDSCIVVFYMTVEPDGRKALVKELKKLSGFVSFEQLSGTTLLKWCNQQLKPFKKKLSATALDELTLMAGQDLTRLSTELKKLVAYTGDRPEILSEDIQTIVSPSPEYNVFKILELLLSGRTEEAAVVVKTVLQTESVVRVIILLADQLRLNAHIKSGEESGNDAEVIRALNIKPGRVYHIRRLIQGIPSQELLKRYQYCVDANYAITSGQMKDRAVLDALLIKLTLPANATKRTSNPSKKQANRRF